LGLSRTQPGKKLHRQFHCQIAAWRKALGFAFRSRRP
jgi:hypothetical protein